MFYVGIWPVMFWLVFGLIAEVAVRLLVGWRLARSSKRPASLVERAMSKFDAGDLNVCGVVVLGERVEEGALLAALRVVGRARFARTRVSGGLVSEAASVPAPHLKVVDGVAKLENDIPSLIEREVNASLPDDGCPFRAVLVRERGWGSARDAVVVTGRHLLFDGLSALELLRRVLILVKDPAASFPDGGIENCDDYLVLPKCVLGLVVQVLLVVIELLRETSFLTVNSRASQPTGSASAVSLHRSAGNLANSHSCCLHVTLEDDLSRRLIEKARSQGTTMGNVVAAAAMQTIEGSGDVWLSIQADFRRIYGGHQPGFLFGNLTPVVSIARSRKDLLSRDMWQVATSMQKELRGAWGPLRLTASYFLYYGVLAQMLLPLVGRFVVKFLSATPVPVPILTMSNLGVIAAGPKDVVSTSRPPLWSAEDVARMPLLQSFFGAVTEPVFFRHFVLGSYSFLGKVTISANFSRFAMTRDEAKLYLDKLCRKLEQGAINTQ